MLHVTGYSSSADLRSCVLILLMLFFLSGGTLTASTTADIPFRGSYRLPLLSNFSASGICRRMYPYAWGTGVHLPSCSVKSVRNISVVGMAMYVQSTDDSPGPSLSRYNEDASRFTLSRPRPHPIRETTSCDAPRNYSTAAPHVTINMTASLILPLILVCTVGAWGEPGTVAARMARSMTRRLWLAFWDA